MAAVLEARLRNRKPEVDFVAQRGKRVVAIEVKSSRARDGLPGMDALAASHRVDRAILVGQDGIPLERFLTQPTESLFTR